MLCKSECLFLLSVRKTWFLRVCYLFYFIIFSYVIIRKTWFLKVVFYIYFLLFSLAILAVQIYFQGWQVWMFDKKLDSQLWIFSYLFFLKKYRNYYFWWSNLELLDSISMHTKFRVSRKFRRALNLDLNFWWQTDTKRS
jgi:hypothetical protein